MKDKIKDFWEQQALEHGESYKATVPDKYLKELEIRAILENLPHQGLVADVGCGNGYSDLFYARERKDVFFECFDYSKQMIDIAVKVSESSKLSNLSFSVMDIESFDFVDKYDSIVTDRCLINLEDRDKQRDAIVRIVRALKNDGKYIMCEDSLQGLSKLNRLRKAVGLDEIEVRWHNKYIDEDILQDLEREGLIKIEGVNNFSAFYYIASRVVNGKIAQENNVEPDYESAVNRIAKDITMLDGFGDCTPLKIFTLKKAEARG